HAERNYREALQRDPRLANSRLGLAKIFQRQEKYTMALTELELAEQADPSRSDVHYIRGQVLSHVGRKEESRKELERAVQLKAKEEEQSSVLPSPEVLQDQQ